jgi:hypothetical protein
MKLSSEREEVNDEIKDELHEYQDSEQDEMDEEDEEDEELEQGSES